MEYLSVNQWCTIARPVDTATDMTDLLQPLLLCESWDWHGAVTACVLIKWAGLLFIIGMSEAVKPCWQDPKEGSNYLQHMPLATTLEGSPRGHLWNMNMRYIHGDTHMIDCDKIRANSDKLDETFNNLHQAEPPQVPSRHTTADACMVLHRVTVVSAEVKSSSNKNDVGFHQQALLLADFFVCWDPMNGPTVAIGLHMNASKICLQMLELQKADGHGFKTTMLRKVFSSNGY